VPHGATAGRALARVVPVAAALLFGEGVLQYLFVFEWDI
jgi:hypothetical protein